MSEQKWEVGPVKLVNGTDGYIDFVHDRGKSIIYTGRFKTCDGDWWAIHWNESGRVPNSCDGYGHNLAPPPKKTMRFRRFICLYQDGGWSSHLTERESAREASKCPFAVFEIDREVTEGEGLTETSN